MDEEKKIKVTKLMIRYKKYILNELYLNKCDRFTTVVCKGEMVFGNISINYLKITMHTNIDHITNDLLCGDI